jgi:hypothetical protein
MMNEEFTSWFETAASNAQPAVQKGARSIIILILWRLWKARNDIVFREATPNRRELVLSILEDAKLWFLAGAKALRQLPSHPESKMLPSARELTGKVGHVQLQF